MGLDPSIWPVWIKCPFYDQAFRLEKVQGGVVYYFSYDSINMGFGTPGGGYWGGNATCSNMSMPNLITAGYTSI